MLSARLPLPPGCEVLVLRRSWFLLAFLVLLGIVARRSDDLPRDETPLALHLGERFGTTNLTYNVQDELTNV